MHTAPFALPTWTKQDRKALLSHCQTYDERTRLPGRRGGTIGATALEVLEALLFKLTDPLTGACIASCREIQRVTRFRRTAVKRATAILDEMGLALKRFRAGTGLFPNDANAYEFADPRAVFRRFFGQGGGRGEAPSNSPSQIPLVSSRRTTRQPAEIVLAEIEAPADPPGVMTDEAWAAAVQPALDAAAAPAGDDAERIPAAEAARKPAQGGAGAWSRAVVRFIAGWFQEARGDPPGRDRRQDSMIVKIQRPLGSSEPDPPALVYDQRRRYHAAVPLSAEILEALGDRAKVYCEAEVTGGKLVIGRRVADQPW